MIKVTITCNNCKKEKELPPNKWDKVLREGRDTLLCPECNELLGIARKTVHDMYQEMIDNVQDSFNLPRIYSKQEEKSNGKATS